MTIERAIESIRNGKVVGLPTDTVYGIGANPLSDEAVGLLYELKERPEHRPVGLLASSLDQASRVGEIDGIARELALRHWPGALTLVVVPKVVLADWVGDSQRLTVGLRVPDHPAALELLAAVGPLAVTSANISGGPEAMDATEARAVFGDRVAVYLEGAAGNGVASTVVDATTARLVVLRQGPVRL